MDTIAKTITSAVTNLITTASEALQVPTAQVQVPTAQVQVPSTAQVQVPTAQVQVPTAQAQVKVPSTAQTQAQAQAVKAYNKPKSVGIYSTILITRNIPVNIINVGNNIKQTLERAISLQIEGKCTVDGYIKPNSTRILTYSSGLVNGPDIMFEVTFECLVCSPVEGMHIKCIAKNITKAGIRAETTEDPSPVVIFVARDHHYNQTYFSTIKENDEIKVRVIGQRFELNDKYISVIAELLEPKEDRYTKFNPGGKKPVKLPFKAKQAKLIITED
jgi:DNA-directed RNA polymerase subunit E'/Rpb7